MMSLWRRQGQQRFFQELYLNVASPGLREFIQARALTAASLSQMVLAFPRYFGAIRANMLRLTQPNAVLDRIRENYENIESLYPAAVFPPVTFLVGRFGTAGPSLALLLYPLCRWVAAVKQRRAANWLSYL